jgi:hypothetical protein
VKGARPAEPDRVNTCVGNNAILALKILVTLVISGYTNQSHFRHPRQAPRFQPETAMAKRNLTVDTQDLASRIPRIPFPGSRNIHIEGSRPDICAPFRELSLTEALVAEGPQSMYLTLQQHKHGSPRIKYGMAVKKARTKPATR